MSPKSVPFPRAPQKPHKSRQDVDPWTNCYVPMQADRLSPLYILDGGLATALEAAGHDLSTNLWSARLLASHPGAITAAHESYYRAGADVAITASYQASVPGLRAGLPDLKSDDDAVALIQRSAQLAFEARDRVLSTHSDRQGKLLVAGSIGPYGAYLANGAEYTGDYGHIGADELRAFHLGRIRALVDARVDLLACETIPTALEVEVLCDLLLGPEFEGVEAWMSFTLRDSEHISDGTRVEDVLAVVEKCPRIIAVGFNCIPLSMATPALRHVASLTRLPLVIYPNSGEEWDAGSKTWHGAPGGKASLAEHASTWRQLGARYIGGCCRLGSQDIETISGELRK